MVYLQLNLKGVFQGSRFKSLIYAHLPYYKHQPIQAKVMRFFSNIFGRKSSSDSEMGTRVGGTEDFMTLIRVYYQAIMATHLGIRDLRALPDLRVFKQTLKVPTINNRIGPGEKARCKKMLCEIYGLPESFCSEIESSIKRRCKTANDMQSYLYQFQGFSQELLTLMTNIVSWKYRLPGFLKGTLRNLTSKAVKEIFSKNSWNDAGIQQSVMNVRAYQKQLGYSQEWMTDFVYNIVLLSKKEKPKDSTATE